VRHDQAHVFLRSFLRVLDIDKEQFLLKLSLHKHWKNENISEEKCSKQKAKSIVAMGKDHI